LRIRSLFAAALPLVLLASRAEAAPTAPSGPHPRIWLTPPTLSALKTNMTQSGSAAASVIARCKDVAARPSKYDDAVYQGYGWAYAAASCGMAYQLTGDSSHASAGLRMFHALLEDYQTVGDGVGGDTVEQHDGGYSMRYFGAFSAIAYDWLHDAPGVDASLLDRARSLFKTWVEWYETNGYLKDAPGSNYHAGYFFAKTMIAIAASGEDDGSAARYWTDVVDNMYEKQLVARGFAEKGPLAGGDWPEGWEYGPLGTLEYALSARALGEHGVPVTDAQPWASAVVLHYHYALTPDRKGFLAGGDWGTASVNATPSPQPLLAAMAGPGSDEAAGFAAFMHANSVTDKDENPVYEALAEARGARPADFVGTPHPAFYLVPGTRKIYARSGWDDKAFWAAFTSGPKFGVDHQHLDASNFVFSRGPDPILADPSPYGSLSTLTGNAISVDSRTVQDNYRPSQSPYSHADLPWARATQNGVAAARADLARAFADDAGTSDVPFARRDWVFLPEGEIVTIDRVRTDSPSRKTYLRFRSPGAFAQEGSSATANVGGSKLVIHAVTLSGGTPTARALNGNANNPCDSGAFGVCDAARFNAGEYAVAIPGPSALAVHVLDGLGTSESPADAVAVGDPAVVGAQVTRGNTRAFVVASSARDGATAGGLGYKAAGDRVARHVVFDAPEDANGKSAVSAKADGAACSIAITAGAGDGAFEGRPLVFQVGAAPGCAVTEDKGAHSDPPGPGDAPPAGGPSAANGAASAANAGCGCRASSSEGQGGLLVLGALVCVSLRSRRRAK
jgi:hypothetical protein